MAASRELLDAAPKQRCGRFVFHFADCKCSDADTTMRIEQPLPESLPVSTPQE